MKKATASKLLGAAIAGLIMIGSAGCYPYWWHHRDYDRWDGYRHSDRYYDRYDWRGDRWDHDRYR